MPENTSVNNTLIAMGYSSSAHPRLK